MQDASHTHIGNHSNHVTKVETVVGNHCSKYAIFIVICKCRKLCEKNGVLQRGVNSDRVEKGKTVKSVTFIMYSKSKRRKFSQLSSNQSAKPSDAFALRKGTLPVTATRNISTVELRASKKITQKRSTLSKFLKCNIT